MINLFSKKQIENEINRFLMMNDLPEVSNLDIGEIERVYPVLCDVGISYQGNFTDKFSKYRIKESFSLEEKLRVAKSLY